MDEANERERERETKGGDSERECCNIIMENNSREKNMGLKIYNAIIIGIIEIGMDSIYQNYIEVEIYDSKRNKSTLLETMVENMVRIEGQVHSNGKFYWLHEVHVLESYNVE